MLLAAAIALAWYFFLRWQAAMVAHGIREDLENEGEPVPEFYELVQTAQDRMANSGFVWNIGCFPIILFFVLLFVFTFWSETR